MSSAAEERVWSARLSEWCCAGVDTHTHTHTLWEGNSGAEEKVPTSNGQHKNGTEHSSREEEEAHSTATTTTTLHSPPPLAHSPPSTTVPLLVLALLHEIRSEVTRSSFRDASVALVVRRCYCFCCTPHPRCCYCSFHSHLVLLVLLTAAVQRCLQPHVRRFLRLGGLLAGALRGYTQIHRKAIME